MSRKMINFDLDTKALQTFYPKADWHNAYSDIRSFLQKEGFEHRQGSGYISKSNITYSEIQVIIDNLSRSNSWLSQCINKCDVTSVGATFDLTGIIKSGATAKKVEELQSDEIYLSEEKSIFKSR